VGQLGDVVIWIFLVHFQELHSKLLRFECCTNELAYLLFIKTELIFKYL